jgi:hypothetical protein
MFDLEIRRRIAGEILCADLAADGFSTCPGRHLHTGRDGRRDFVVRLDGAPTFFCLHSSCAGVLEALNAELRSRIGRAESDGNSTAPRLGEPLPPEPTGPRLPKRPPFDLAHLEDFASRCRLPHGVDLLNFLAARSPWPVPSPLEQSSKTASTFLDAIFAPGDRILIFTKQFSQGDFLHLAGAETFRLASKPGVRAVPSPCPSAGPEGVWYLVQPVRGDWQPNQNNKDEAGQVQLGRRHAACVTRWPNLVLESDEAPADLWLRALVQLPLPIRAIYTSGGRSVHALVRVNAQSKADFDSIRDQLAPLVCPLGADPGALSAVRLSRLPGCVRLGKRTRDGNLERYPTPRLQRLIWLDPSAPFAPIQDRIPL